MSSQTVTSSSSARASRRRPLTKARNFLLIAAGASLAVSVSLWFAGNREEGLFVGLWVPSILAAGNLFLLTSGRSS